MVSTDVNHVCGPKKQWAATFESKDYTSKFFVMCIIVLFHRKETSRVKGNGVNTIFKFLSNNYSKGVVKTYYCFRVSSGRRRDI